MIVGAADLSKGDLAPLQRIIDPALMICIMLSHPFRKKNAERMGHGVAYLLGRISSWLAPQFAPSPTTVYLLATPAATCNSITR